MKYLGIDYGTKHVGLATAEDGGMAFPLNVVPNTPSLVADIVAVCAQAHIDMIVVGDSLNFQNERNAIMNKVVPFSERLKKETGLPVAFMNEVLSSREAVHIQGDNDQNDASAAALVLQSYLDKIHPRTTEEFFEDE